MVIGGGGNDVIWGDDVGDDALDGGDGADRCEGGTNTLSDCGLAEG